MLDQIFRSEMTGNIITVLFALATFRVLFQAKSAVKSGNRSKDVEIASTMMTSLGILGTFVGIVIGLMVFDPAHVDESIKGLLGGLRTAFLTSVVGMGCTMYFKWWDAKQTPSVTANDQNTDSIGPKDIYAILRKHQELTSLLVQAVGGGEENSLVGQMKLLRTEVVDFRSGHQRTQHNFETKLWDQLQAFSEMLSKSATEQVIEALRQVIVEFNQKLTEQFGDNFKRLDESVKKLVDWQIAYKEQLEKMITLFDQGVKSIDATRGAVVEIKDKTGRIPADMQALSEVLNINQHQIQELSRHLDAFISMRQQAIQAVPEIQNKLEEVGLKIREGADRMNRIILEGAAEFGENVTSANHSLVRMAGEVATRTEGISEELTNAMIKVEQNTDRIRTGVSDAIQVAMDSVKTAVENTSQTTMLAVSETTRNMAHAVKQTSQTMIDEVGQSSDAVKQAVEATTSALRHNVERSLTGVEKQILDAVGKTGEAVNVQLRAVDQALEKQLNMALSQLGSALATIATHLVDNYKRQVRELKSTEA
jgi:hypothetical protein